MTARATAGAADCTPLVCRSPATTGEESAVLCPLVQLDGRKGGQVTVDESRLPAATVLALFLDGCEIERLLGMYPWLDETHAAVLHRLAADLSGRGVTVGGDEDA